MYAWSVLAGTAVGPASMTELAMSRRRETNSDEDRSLSERLGRGEFLSLVVVDAEAVDADDEVGRVEENRGLAAPGD